MIPLFKFNILIVAVLAGAMLLSACEKEDTEVTYAKEGIVVEAKIGIRYTKKFKTQQGTMRDYYVSYSFKTQEGTIVKGHGKITKEIYRMVRKGQPIMVQYLESNPRKSRLPLHEFIGLVDDL